MPRQWRIAPNQWLLLRQMEALSTQNAFMVQELAELRRENVLLRRRLEEVSGLVHQPYASGPVSVVGLPARPTSLAASSSAELPPQPGLPQDTNRLVEDMTTDSPVTTLDPEAKRQCPGGSFP